MSKKITTLNTNKFIQCMCKLHLGALEDCLTWASGGHVTFWHLWVAFFAMISGAINHTHFAAFLPF